MHGEKKVILLVEDEVINAMAQAEELQKYNYEIITIHSGSDAIKLVREKPEIDLILMDINLSGGIDGAEAAARILSERTIPILFLSNHTHPDVVEKTNHVGSYGYIVKDSGVTVIDTSIKMALNLYEEKQRVLRHKEELENAYRELRIKNQQLIKSEDNLKKSDKKLSGMENFYSNILDSVVNGVWTTDKDDIVTYVNRGMLILVDIEITRILGNKALTDFPESVQKSLGPFYQKAKNSLQPVYYENIHIITRANLEFFHSGYLIPRVENGEYQGMICTVEDTTERVVAVEMLRESEKRFRLIFEHAGAGISFFDPQARYVLMNDYQASILGGVSHDFIGKTLYEVFPDSEEKNRKRFERIILTKKGDCFEEPFILPDGATRWFSLNMQPVVDKDNTVLGIQIISIDITKQKNAEQKLASMSDSL